MKFSKFFLILRIFKWRIENQSVLQLTKKLWNWSGNKYVVSKFQILFLKKFRSGSQELFSKMSLLPSSKLYFKDSKFIFKLTSFICVHFVHLEPQEKKIDTKNNNREKKSYLRSLTGTMTTVQFSFCSNP